MSIEQSLRPQFFEGQYLGSDDLTSAVEYSRLQQERHRLGAHTWGIALGLNLIEVPSPNGGTAVDLYITPGYASDGFGRTVVLLSPYKLPIELFQLCKVPAIGDTSAGFPVKVWLQYREASTDAPGPGYDNCNVAGAYARVSETFQVIVGEQSAAALRDNISVNGQSLDAGLVLQQFEQKTNPPLVLKDASVPYQELPDDRPTARWLIPVGYVRWVPSQAAADPGSFATRNDDDKAASESARMYMGVVAGSLLPAGTHVCVRDRTAAPPSVPSDDVFWVEGKLRVHGEARLFHSPLTLLDENGSDSGNPLRIQREDQPDGASLEAVIGSKNQGKNTFAVGPVDPAHPAQFLPKMIVRDDGRVGIGTIAPDRLLTLLGAEGTYANVKAKNGQIEILAGADDNGGIVSTMTNHDLVLRAGGNQSYVWVKKDGKVGIGTASPTFTLDIKGDFGRNDGAATAHFWGSTIGDTGGGIFLLKSGGSVIATQPGNSLGIGTTTPADTLDVAGNMRVNTGGNPLRFTSSWSAFPDASTNQAEISNDTNNFKTLMIVGNKSAGLGRRVSVWDLLEVTGTLQVFGRIGTQVGASTFLANSGYPAGWGGGIHTWDLYAEGSVGVGSNGSLKGWLRNDGMLEIKGDAIKPGGGSWSSPSDLRLKSHVKPLKGVLEKLLQLRGVQFEWKEPAEMGNLTGAQFGFVAQDVEPAFPQWVSADQQGLKRLTLRGFEALVVESLRELKTELDSLNKRLTAIESRKVPAHKTRKKKNRKSEVHDEPATD